MISRTGSPAAARPGPADDRGGEIKFLEERAGGDWSMIVLVSITVFAVGMDCFAFGSQ